MKNITNEIKISNPPPELDKNFRGIVNKIHTKSRTIREEGIKALKLYCSLHFWQNQHEYYIFY